MDSVTGTGYQFRYGFVLCICFRIRAQEIRKLCYLFYVFVSGYELRRLVSFVICFMYLFQDTSSGDS